RHLRAQGHVGRRVQGLGPVALPRVRQDRHGGARAAARPGLVRVLREGQEPPDRHRRDDREGRLRRGHCGTGGASHPRSMVGYARPPVPRRLERDTVSVQTTIQPASEPPPPLVPREWRLRLDPLLLLSSLGLVAASLIVLKGATRNDIQGDPLYYVK